MESELCPRMYVCAAIDESQAHLFFTAQIWTASLEQLLVGRNLKTLQEYFHEAKYAGSK